MEQLLDPLNVALGLSCLFLFLLLAGAGLERQLIKRRLRIVDQEGSDGGCS